MIEQVIHLAKASEGGSYLESSVNVQGAEVKPKAGFCSFPETVVNEIKAAFSGL